MVTKLAAKIRPVSILCILIFFMLFQNFPTTDDKVLGQDGTNDENGWEVTTLAKTMDIVHYFDIAVDGNGNVHVIYSDVHNYLFYTNLTSGWKKIPLNSKGKISTNSLVVDSENQPNVCFLNSEKSVVYYCLVDDIWWNDTIAEYISGETPTYYIPSIKRCDDGLIYIYYREFILNDENVSLVIYTKMDDYLEKNTVPIDFYTHHNMIIDNSHKYHLFLENNFEENRTGFQHLVKMGDEWVVVDEIETHQDSSVEYISMDSKNELFIIYEKIIDTFNNELYYTYESNNVWKDIFLVKGDKVGRGITVDNNDLIHIFFSCEQVDSETFHVSDQKILHFRGKGSSWETETVIEETGSNLCSTVDAYGNLHLLYENGGDLKYAYKIIDSDFDGVLNEDDANPDDPAASVDTDSDGYPDDWNTGKTEEDSTTGLKLDDFPDDPTEWNDTDKDGVGDNTDLFPNNPDEWSDSDNDSVGDNSDKFPTDPSASIDTDNDGSPDSWNEGFGPEDSTSDPPLVIDPYPDDPDNEATDDDDDDDDSTGDDDADDDDTGSSGSDGSGSGMLLIIGLVAAIAIAAFLFFSKKKEPVGKLEDANDGSEAKDG